MMTAPQPILDYASPRPRGKVRLPARSVLAVRESPGRVEVVERLVGQLGAIAAIVFAGFALTMLVFATLDMLRRNDVCGTIFLIGFALTGYVVMGMVINSTWRRTTLIADAGGIELRFFGPLSGVRRHGWEAAKVERVIVVVTETSVDLKGIDLSRSTALAELQVQTAAGQDAHLFTDHQAFELAGIADAIRRAMGRAETAG